MLTACAFMLAACASSRVMLGPARAPISPDQVTIYFRPPPGKYRRIALLQTSSAGAFAFTAQGKTDAVIARLKEEAAKLGANGVLLQGIGDRAVGSIGTGFARTSAFDNGGWSSGIGISGAMTQKAGSGIAIYVEPGARASPSPGKLPALTSIPGTVLPICCSS
ncbi:MAG TPA: hypothetical protein VMU86_03855, partial [Steroidobacteraceae bacterium]|nr:hypothetical protein [Steroidobacteraceae bacterium]